MRGPWDPPLARETLWALVNIPSAVVIVGDYHDNQRRSIAAGTLATLRGFGHEYSTVETDDGVRYSIPIRWLDATDEDLRQFHLEGGAAS